MEAQKKNEVIVKKNKKWIIPVVASVITVLVVVAALIILFSIKSSGKDEKLQEQLDLGDKYLSELDYEQAIVAYETAIEIDPMSVDAYLGLASVYEVQGDYDKAIEVLETGYLQTNSEILFSKIEAIKNLITDGENNIDNDLLEENVMNEYENGVPDRVVEGVYHNAYYTYEISEDEAIYLNKIIELLGANDFAGALSALDYNTTYNLIDSLGLLEMDYGRDEGSVNLYFENKKIYLNVQQYGEEQKIFSMIVLPLDEGMGYGLNIHYMFDCTKTTYLYGECKEGVFWGEFQMSTEYEYIIQEENGTFYTIGHIEIRTGNTINGLLDGVVVEVSKDSQGYEYTPREVAYECGKLVYWDIVMNDDGNAIVFIGPDESNAHIEYIDTTIEQAKEDIDNEYYSITEIGTEWEYYNNSGTCCSEDGETGINVYPW